MPRRNAFIVLGARLLGRTLHLGKAPLLLLCRSADRLAHLGRLGQEPRSHLVQFPIVPLVTGESDRPNKLTNGEGLHLM